MMQFQPEYNASNAFKEKPSLKNLSDRAWREKMAMFWAFFNIDAINDILATDKFWTSNTESFLHQMVLPEFWGRPRERKIICHLDKKDSSIKIIQQL
ncbi:hypothetical protein VTP01DRAFT_10630 [Rhizomucor pusillus]|uniref:uncharacterized protein n=1 Tax=Rhizomucor pusillus TaxID=4840 RepID=UPI0037439A3A